ncbi:MAG: flavodoxin-dependent (E)-4-hydroxy-3-methylbut-2-enyl-diphosphate synthase [Dehalococcoidales bacterium]|nr:flavodoxin-dependent (E)-4-hydroxy-3-methylbut-2-enyl-diphosphate synthase [Dehalococcoidales bacterium]
MPRRRVSRQIQIAGVKVGGGAPVSVQSMTNTDTRDAQATINQIKELEEYGCEIIRVAVPDMQAAQALKIIKKGIKIPLIADIHFDHRLALAALANGVDGLRLNPGNIREAEKIKQVVLLAKDRSVPIRIGLNAGSLPKTNNPRLSVSTRMVKAALEQVELLESLDFNLIKISLKAFDVPTTIDAYKKMAARVDYPLHVGITESGTPRTGLVRSSVGIGTLLYLGIGDTIRVSLTAHPREEVVAGYEILKSLNLREHGPTLVSCPTCGRTEVNFIPMVDEICARLAKVEKPLKVAVMGCAVNGPGEAMDADVGVACGKGKGVIFRKGEQVKVVPEAEIIRELMAEVERM